MRISEERPLKLGLCAIAAALVSVVVSTSGYSQSASSNTTHHRASPPRSASLYSMLRLPSSKKTVHLVGSVLISGMQLPRGWE